VGPAVVVIAVVCALVIGCRSEPSVSTHAAIGRWGVATQSGQLVEAFELRADGTYTITDAAGSGVREGTGSFSVVDSETLRTEDAIGPDETPVVFTVSGDHIRMESGTQSLSGFERMPER